MLAPSVCRQVSWMERRVVAGFHERPPRRTLARGVRQPQGSRFARSVAFRSGSSWSLVAAYGPLLRWFQEETAEVERSASRSAQTKLFPNCSPAG
jgi:hypothetical protein